MLEKDFQSKFSKWLKYRYAGNGCFELKLCKAGSLPFNAVAEHQVNALYQAKHSNIIYKIPDAGFTNPFDCFRIEGVPAYVVVMFYTRATKEFSMIDIDDFIQEMKLSKRKSLTENRARVIGRQCVLE